MAVLYDMVGKIVKVSDQNKICDNSGMVYQYLKPSSSPSHDYSQDYLTFEAISAGTFSCTSACSYSVDDGATWTALAANASTPTVNAGDKILFKATNSPTTVGGFPYGIGIFGATADFNAMGNPYSMLSGDSFTAVTTLPDYALLDMFSGNTKLVSAENLALPASNLSTYCYGRIFRGCTSLVTAPDLPATTLADGCYSSMFHSCTSLTTAPALPATTMSVLCYDAMFHGCTSLTTAPELPATTLADSCYQGMFNGCSSLATAPELPATTLENYCYVSMFFGCTSLTTAPELPATAITNGCYSSMFRGCTSLTTAPELPASTLLENCYYRLFYDCTSLNYIKMLATELSTVSNYEWVSGVASSGTFVKNSAMTTFTSGVSGIPENWTVVDAT